MNQQAGTHIVLKKKNNNNSSPIISPNISPTSPTLHERGLTHDYEQHFPMIGWATNWTSVDSRN